VDHGLEATRRRVAGNISALDAMKSMKATLDSLPASKKK